MKECGFALLTQLVKGVLQVIAEPQTVRMIWNSVVPKIASSNLVNCWIDKLVIQVLSIENLVYVGRVVDDDHHAALQIIHLMMLPNLLITL